MPSKYKLVIVFLLLLLIISAITTVMAVSGTLPGIQRRISEQQVAYETSCYKMTRSNLNVTDEETEETKSVCIIMVKTVSEK